MKRAFFFRQLYFTSASAWTLFMLHVDESFRNDMLGNWGRVLAMVVLLCAGPLVGLFDQCKEDGD